VFWFTETVFHTLGRELLPSPLDKLSTLGILSDMDSETTKLGACLRSARDQRKLSLRAVERATGISNAYLSQIESGKIREPSPTVLHKLAELYNVPYADLMSLAGYPDAGPAPSEKATADSRLGPMTPDEERAVREYLEFLRSKRGKRGGG
jgi:transcriptional regulator with XRE-family HTH domain